MPLRQTAKDKRQKEENGLVINFSHHFTFAFSRDVNKNWLFSTVVKYVRDHMLQYDGFYYARHKTIAGGEVKSHTSQRLTRQKLISGFRTMKQAYE